MGKNHPMRRFALALACWISLGIAIPGYAGLLSAKAPCPLMQQAQASGQQAPDCCDDIDAFLHSGQYCSAGLGGPAVGQASRPPLTLAALVPTFLPFTAMSQPRLDSFDPSRVWRPPTPI
jgi:hypothetical protein